MGGYEIRKSEKTKLTSTSALVSARIWFIHPSQQIMNKFPNPVTRLCLENCVTLWQEVKMVFRKEHLCLVVHHDDFKNVYDTFIELYSVRRNLGLHDGAITFFCSWCHFYQSSFLWRYSNHDRPSNQTYQTETTS